VAGRLIVDLDEDGTVSVGSQASPDELPSVVGRATLAWPLDEKALEDLRWYLEDYLVAPFGVYEDRGAQVEASLSEWGKRVFSAVFGSGPARDAYLGMRARGDVEVVFRSSSPRLLGLPWELMTDPGRERPLALDVVGVSRSLTATADAAQTVAVPDGRLRVLMVISRPAGTSDVGYRMIARPLLERLEAVRGAVDLVVLRPPTLEALRTELASAVTAGMPYQIVHFDGHGVMPGRSDGAGEGILVFEGSDGGADRVRASRVAQVLADARVPVVVLNACQSGAVGKELEASVATRLLGAGVASVVAMAYSVYAVAAAEFMAAFYETLFAGGTVSAAATAGRLQMWRNPDRPSPKGDLPLADWLVPAHYFRREVRFPRAAVSRPTDLPSLAEALKAVSAATGQTGRGDLDAVDGLFVGRDALFYDLEAAARLQKVAILAGPGGTGKTELAKAFARWWRDTGGVEQPELVFWHSFEPGVATFGLDGVIDAIGRGLYGDEFALLEPPRRRAVVRNALTEHRMLLVWDNFESVRSMPDEGRATPPLDEAGCAELREFLAGMADGKSSVLITSRTAEDWLGDIRRITVGGLAAHEAAEYAGLLLAPYPAGRRRRSGRQFGDLMQWLAGHPLSMRLVLPRLDDNTPEALLAGLRGTEPLPGATAGEGRTGSLEASVAYSYAHLTPGTRRLLPAVSLIHGVADADVLATFSRWPQAPERFAGISRDEWAAALDDAARVGLLARISASLYQIHPALPGYLAAAWQSDEPDYPAARAAATGALLAAHAAFGAWLRREINAGDARVAYALIALERRTLGSLLGHALDHGLWGPAASIIESLDDYWDVRGLYAEADAWADRARDATEAPTGAPPGLDSPAGALWLFVTGSQAGREVKRHHLDRAEGTYRQIMSALQATGASPEQKRHIATTYHHLGRVAQERGDLGAAENWYREALTTREELGNRPDLAAVYHELGTVAQGRGDPDTAQDWYHKALAIQEELGNRPDAAITYHQLGMVAHGRGDPDTAQRWYHKALTIQEELGNRPDLAAVYHELGTVAHGRGDLNTAQDWYHKALTMVEGLGDRPGMEAAYHQLGMVAHDRGDLDTAQDWYDKALTIETELGDRPGLALTCGQCGLLAAKRGRQAEALAWMVRCVSLFDEFPHPATRTAPRALVHLTGALGIGALERTWREVTGKELPEAVRDYINQEGDGQ
jgi:tetratricopeptide (TPR) repeat protein